MTDQHPFTSLERLLQHSDWLAALARRLVADPATAEDLVQDTWIAALRNPPDPSRPARPWLSGVVRRLASLTTRRAARRPDLAAASSAPAAAEVAERVELEQALARKVLELEQPYRDTLLLRYYEGLSAARIARRTGVPAATVRTRLRRGLEKLRVRLDEESGSRREWVLALAPVTGWRSAPAFGTATVLGGLIMGKIAIVAGVVAAAGLLVWLGNSLNEEGESAAAAVHAEPPPAVEPPRVGTTEPTGIDASRRPVNGPGAAGGEPEALEGLATLTICAVEKGTNTPLEHINVLLELARSGGGPPAPTGEGAHEPLPERLTTGPDGMVVFDLPGGRELQVHLYTFTSADPHVGSVELPVEPLSPGEQRELVVELPVGPDLHFVGRAVDDAGEAVRDAAVVVPEHYATTIEGKRVVPTFAETSTDSRGYFALEGISWGRQHARIDAPGFGRVLVVLTTGHETEEKAQVVRLLRAASIEATLTILSGPPASEISLHVTTNFGNLIRPRTGANDTTSFHPVWTARMGPDGKLQLAGLPPGVPLEVELRRGEEVLKRIADELSLEPGKNHVFEWTLGGGATVRGIAVDAQRNPAPGLELWLVPDEQRPWRGPSGRLEPKRARYLTWRDGERANRAITDAEGKFRFPGVEPGSWLCGPASLEAPDASGPPPLIAPLAQVVEVESEGDPREVVIEVTRGLYIRGRVLDADGAPFGGQWLRLTSTNLSTSRDYLADASGEFTVGPLAPGEVWLKAFGGGSFGDSPRVQAAAGDTDVVLRLVAAGLLRGHIIDPATGEGCRAELRLIDSTEPLGYERWKHSDQSTGAFQLEKLETGTYHLLARADDGGIALLRNLSIQAGQTQEGLELRLERGAVLKVRSGDESEGGFTLYHEGLAVGHGFFGPGKTSQQTLFPGVTTVYYRGSKEGELEVELTPGERRELALPPEE